MAHGRWPMRQSLGPRINFRQFCRKIEKVVCYCPRIRLSTKCDFLNTPRTLGALSARNSELSRNCGHSRLQHILRILQRPRMTFGGIAKYLNTTMKHCEFRWVAWEINFLDSCQWIWQMEVGISSRIVGRDVSNFICFVKRLLSWTALMVFHKGHAFSRFSLTYSCIFG